MKRRTWKSIPDEVRIAVYERDGYRCYHCGCIIRRGGKKDNTGVRVATLDHYIPYSQGGSNRMENLRACCRPCNESKNGKIPKDLRFFGHCYPKSIDGRIFVMVDPE